MMAQSLLMLRTTLDELPIGLYSSRRRAVEALDALTVVTIQEAADLMEVDYAGVVCAAIVTFRKGLPVGLSIEDLPAALETELERLAEEDRVRRGKTTRRLAQERNGKEND